MAQVGTDGVVRHEQALSYLAVGETLSDQPCHG